MTAQFKPVSVSKGAFLFCRYSLALILWLALILHWKWLVIITFVIFSLSAYLTVKNAPMIFFYEKTIEKIHSSGKEVLDIHAMRFAHTIGAVFSLSCIILLFINENAGWNLLFVFALLKTVSALGFCPASKLYTCTLSGKSCCSFLKGKKC